MENVNLYPWFVFNEAAFFRFEIRIISRIVPTDYQNGIITKGCTRLLLYCNTNKPHSFFFLQNTSCIRKPQVISGGCAPVQ